MGLESKLANGTTVVSNGGKPLPGCPESWEEANAWVDKANKEKEKHYEPEWGFDCGFKLDFDGPIVSVSSRFYPPANYYGATWDGTVSIYVLNREVKEIKFDTKNLNDLKDLVEKEVRSIAEQILKIFPKKDYPEED